MRIATIGVEDWLNVHEKDATVDIAQSTIASLTQEEILALGDGPAEFYDRLDREKMNYGWIEGSPAFKERVAGLYRTVDPDNVLQANGATGANLLAIMALVEPGDHVVAEYPTYQPLYELPRSLGADVDYWRIHEELGWEPDIDELRRIVTPDTKLICINNASNPTGTVLSRGTLEQIVEIADASGAYILSDEVYLPLEDGCDHASIADLYDRGVATNSLSKTYSVPGIRMGWTASNAEVAERIRVLRDYTMICGGVFNDAMAVHVLDHRDQIIERNRAIILENRAIVERWIAGEPRASWVPPRGVSTSYLRLDIPVGDEEFCLNALERRGLLLVPGSRFELPCGARLGYCAPKETLCKGLRLLSEALAEFD